MRQEKMIEQQEQSLPALKKETRDEIMKRLLLSVDYMYANPSENISVHQLAQVACLSKFHYIRLFKQAFGKSPHRFLSEAKVDRAKGLLEDIPSVREVAHQTGFDSPATFSRMFYNITGLFPTQFVALQ